MKRTISFLLIVFVVAITTSSQLQSSSQMMALSFPGKSWTMKIGSPGFVASVNGPMADGRQYLVANNETTGVVLSITLERAQRADRATCPEYLKKRVAALPQSGFHPTNVRFSTTPSLDIAEYFISEVQGIAVQQENLVACTVKDDVYADIHLSKAPVQPADVSAFAAVLNSIQFEEALPPVQSAAQTPQDSRYYMRVGSRYFLNQQFKESIAPYQRALDLEKQNAKLEKNLWRALVDNLGMAYGITGDLKNAESTFQYGLSKDPTYPMFFYNMACTYAERDDLDKTLTYLKKAFDYRANIIPGETMPDPRSDDSFKRYLDNPKFQALVDSIAPKK
jgi:tetratricopeptide (TPR) repeat protein